ncbi:MAG TPA: hypothetical protein PKD49_13190 [Hyphomicrobium sp.]|nr:hypothetical protein [Hyphomicrobium sp.]
MALKRIRIELARDPDFPTGSRERGYDFIAPLDDNGQLILDEWRENRDRCRVRRFWPGEKDEIGRLVHRRGGSWAFDYDPEETSDDEAGFKLGKHRFAPGEYVSFTEHDGKSRTFRVMSVLDFE